MGNLEFFGELFGVRLAAFLHLSMKPVISFVGKLPAHGSSPFLQTHGGRMGAIKIRIHLNLEYRGEGPFWAPSDDSTNIFMIPKK
jgi:hypothetical protein